MILPHHANPGGMEFSERTASQVTAIVQRLEQQPACSSVQYLAAIEAELVYPFFIKLIDPLIDNSLGDGRIEADDHRANAVGNV